MKEKQFRVMNDLDMFLVKTGNKQLFIFDDFRMTTTAEKGGHYWLKETWQMIPENARSLSDIKIMRRIPGEKPSGVRLIYRSDIIDQYAKKAFLWNNPMSMPYWASRISIRINDIQHKMLNDISYQEMFDYGIEYLPEYQFELEDPETVNKEDYTKEVFCQYMTGLFDTSKPLLLVSFDVIRLEANTEINIEELITAGAHYE